MKKGLSILLIAAGMTYLLARTTGRRQAKSPQLT